MVGGQPHDAARGATTHPAESQVAVLTTTRDNAYRARFPPRGTVSWNGHNRPVHVDWEFYLDNPCAGTPQGPDLIYVTTDDLPTLSFFVELRGFHPDPS